MREYWEKVLEGVDRPSALKLLPQLDLGHPLGFTAQGEKAKGSSMLVPFMIKTKRAHPTKVLLVRVRACVLWHPACAASVIAADMPEPMLMHPPQALHGVIPGAPAPGG